MGHLGRRRHRHPTTRHPDAGVTFVEILVAIVLLGTAVIGTLTAVRATIISAEIERDHARAQQWLQSAAAVVEADDYIDCADPGADETMILSGYTTEMNLSTTPPHGFQGTIQAIEIDVWDGTDFVPFADQVSLGFCLDDVALRQQLITIEVQAVGGGPTESLELVKADR